MGAGGGGGDRPGGGGGGDGGGDGDGEGEGEGEGIRWGLALTALAVAAHAGPAGARGIFTGKAKEPSPQDLGTSFFLGRASHGYLSEAYTRPLIGLT